LNKSAANLFILLTFLIFTACGPSRYARLKESVNFRETPPQFLKAPLKNYVVLSPFGKRGKSFHTGIDVRSKGGQSLIILAAGAGRVIKAGKMNGYGRFVSIRHEKGYVTLYAHLRKFLVKAGQWVKGGDPVGLMGKTGRAKSVHLHFEVIDPDGFFIDPGPLF